MSAHTDTEKAFRTVTVEQAAAALHIHQDTVRRLLRKGKIPGVRVGGQWRIQAAVFDEYLKSGKVPAPGPAVDEEYDTEPLTAEDLKEIRAGLEEIRRGDTISGDEYWRKRGL